MLDIDCGDDASLLPTIRPPNLSPGQKLLRIRIGDGQMVIVPTGKVTGKGLQHIKEMKGLTALALCSDHLTDAGLGDLSRLTSLKWLRLAGSGLSEKGFAALKPLKELEGLELLDGTYGPAGVATLKGLPKLRVLCLPLTTSKDAGTRYSRDLAPNTKTWFGKPWCAMQSPMAVSVSRTVIGGTGRGGFSGQVIAPGFGGKR